MAVLYQLVVGRERVSGQLRRVAVSPLLDAERVRRVAQVLIGREAASAAISAHGVAPALMRLADAEARLLARGVEPHLHVRS